MVRNSTGSILYDKFFNESMNTTLLDDPFNVIVIHKNYSMIIYVSYGCHLFILYCFYYFYNIYIHVHMNQDTVYVNKMSHAVTVIILVLLSV